MSNDHYARAIGEEITNNIAENFHNGMELTRHERVQRQQASDVEKGAGVEIPASNIASTNAKSHARLMHLENVTLQTDRPLTPSYSNQFRTVRVRRSTVRVDGLLVPVFVTLTYGVGAQNINLTDV